MKFSLSLSVKRVAPEIECVLHKNCQIIINFNTLARNIKSTQVINFCILIKFQTILINDTASLVAIVNFKSVTRIRRKLKQKPTNATKKESHDRNLRDVPY